MGQVTLSRPPVFPLAAASRRFRVITKDEIQKRIDEALEKDRSQRADRLHEEAKSRIMEARNALREAISQIEAMKGREAELTGRIEQLQGENDELREELRRFVENAKAAPLAPIHANGNGSTLVEKAAWDSLAARVTKIEELLAAHLLHDHRNHSEDEDPPEANGRGKRRRLR